MVGRHPDPAAAARRCVDGFQAALDGDPAAFQARMLDSCSEVYVEHGCREAFLTAARALPRERMTVLVRGCAAAYCPILPDPKPSLCAGAAETGEVLLWGELQLAILTYDLGPEQTKVFASRLTELHARLSAKLREPIPIEIKPPKPACAGADGKEVLLALLVAQDGVWLGTTDGVTKFVPHCRGRLDAAAIGGELCALRTRPGLDCRQDAEVTARDEVIYADIVALMDIAKGAGFGDLAFVGPDQESVDFPASSRGVPRVPSRCGEVEASCTGPDSSKAANEMTTVSAAELALAPKVLISKREVRVGDRVVALTKDVEAATEWKIPSLWDALRGAGEAFEASALPAETKDRLRGVLVVRIEGDVRSKVVERVLMAAHGAGFLNLMFGDPDPP
jgi:hypothetical protein